MEETSRKRKLPAWLLAAKEEKEDGKQLSLQQEEEKKLPELIFPGKFEYVHQSSECNFICYEILWDRPEANPSKVTHVGLDIEWAVTYEASRESPTAVLQLCIDRPLTCYVFHLSCMKGFPSELKTLLECERIIKVGVGIQGDLQKLERDYGISSTSIIDKSVVDLSKFANSILHCCETWSLDGLCKHVLKRKLLKDSSIRKSDWRRYPLTERQLQYAVVDAYASLLLYQELESRQLRE